MDLILTKNNFRTKCRFGFDVLLGWNFLCHYSDANQNFHPLRNVWFIRPHFGLQTVWGMKKVKMSHKKGIIPHITGLVCLDSSPNKILTKPPFAYPPFPPPLVWTMSTLWLDHEESPWPPDRSENKTKGCTGYTLHGRLTFNRIMEVWKIIVLSKWVICRFHVNLPGCTPKWWVFLINASPSTT